MLRGPAVVCMCAHTHAWHTCMHEVKCEDIRARASSRGRRAPSALGLPRRKAVQRQEPVSKVAKGALHRQRWEVGIGRGKADRGRWKEEQAPGANRNQMGRLPDTQTGLLLVTTRRLTRWKWSAGGDRTHPSVPDRTISTNAEIPKCLHPCPNLFIHALARGFESARPVSFCSEADTTLPFGSGGSHVRFRRSAGK